jgi:hypothetical protein
VRSERLGDDHTGAGCIISLFFHFFTFFSPLCRIHVRQISCTLSNYLLTQTHSSPLCCLFPCLISLFCSFFIVSCLRTCLHSVHQVCNAHWRSHPRTALSRSDSISSHALTLFHSLPLCAPGMQRTLALASSDRSLTVGQCLSPSPPLTRGS